MAKSQFKGVNLTVNVTKEIMTISRDRDSSHCMIATAIKDALPQAASISVDLQTIRFSLPEKRLRYTYLTPRVAQYAIIKFDQGEEQDPFSFRLDGAHVTTMHTRKVVVTPRGPLTVKQQESITKAQKYNPSHQTYNKMIPDHPELSKPVIVKDIQDKKGKVAHRLGGKPPPKTSLARRRSFGLRALVL